MNSAITLLIVVGLIGFSAICSGLNIAIMALDIGDLKRKAKLGNRQARAVLPLRRNTHLALASILLSNVAAVSATSLVLERHFNSFVAGLLSTVLIVVFGEVLPQALFSKNTLGWSSRFAVVLKAMIVLTFVISKPLQLFLDWLFPAPSTGQLQTRQELGLMISEHLTNDSSELDEDEVEIIRGALQLSEKRVRDIMTDIHETYWLTPDVRIDDTRIDELKRNSFSRVPIFDKDLTKCYGILLLKDLIDLDFTDHLIRIVDLPMHPTQLVGSMTALDTMFRKFIASGTHLIPIERDDHIIGVVTIEDLIEEILGHEIEDETDRMKARAT